MADPLIFKQTLSIESLDTIHKAVSAAEARGRNAVLLRVAKLPSPMTMDPANGDWFCLWCGADAIKGREHPPSETCLWPDALAAAAEKET